MPEKDFRKTINKNSNTDGHSGKPSITIIGSLWEIQLTVKQEVANIKVAWCIKKHFPIKHPEAL